VSLDPAVLRQAIADKDYTLTLHASDRAARRAIRTHEIEEAVLTGEVIEDYPEDKYGPSCLISGYTEKKRPLHVQISYPPEVKVITVYEPSSDEWQDDLKTRR
jgi:hypothetical protein